MVEYKFSLELTKNGIQKSVHAKAGEGNLRKLVITLTEAGKVFELAGLNARIFLEDGRYIEDGVLIAGNTVEFILPDALTAHEGIRFFEIKIFKDDDVLYSPMVELIVEKSFGNISYEEATELGKKIQYQELIKTSEYKEKAEMSDEDSIVIYDSATDTVMRLTWAQLREIHNAADSHPIESISGLNVLLNGLNEKIEKAALNSGGKVKKIFIPYDSDLEYGCYSFISGYHADFYVSNNFSEEFNLSEIMPIGLTVLWKGEECSISELNFKNVIGTPDAAFVTLLDPKDIEDIGTDKLFATIHNANGISDSLLEEIQFDNKEGYIGGVYLYYFDKIEDVN